jgi:hypothetical protein
LDGIRLEFVLDSGSNPERLRKTNKKGKPVLVRLPERTGKNLEEAWFD